MKPLRKIAFVPVWLLTLALKPFLPASHPWKYQSMTLESWCRLGTPEAMAISIQFYLSVAVIIFGVYRILKP